MAGVMSSGRVYIEGRLKDDFQGDTEPIHKKVMQVFSLKTVEDLSLILWEDILKSDAFNGLFPPTLESLKAVEHTTELSTEYFPIKVIDLEVYIYQITSNIEHLEDDGTLLQLEIVRLPTSRLEGIWERLVFNTNIRDNLVRLMRNMRMPHSTYKSLQLTPLVKFSTALSNANLSPRTNRLILFSGPPGTGKTTLCQALAQKLSIRLSRTYSCTSLIEIDAAALLSKFFSESAKSVLRIFAAIHSHCTSSPSHFTIVLIDEIESLASSRHRASSLGEIQDTIRATNALLTGFDKVKSLPNLIILCTSNMIDTLDTAFLDRCCHHIIIEDPDVVARYHILRDAIQELIFVGIIRNLHDEQTVFAIPSYRDAQLELLSQPFKAGSVLMKFCNAHDSPKNQQYHRRNSARFLSQLPELALAYRMISDSCTLDEALEHMTRFLHDQVTFVKNPPEDPRIENQCGSSNSELKRKRI